VTHGEAPAAHRPLAALSRVFELSWGLGLSGGYSTLTLAEIAVERPAETEHDKPATGIDGVLTGIN